ncbi:nucleoside-diphosphate sugar epimerase [Stenotrophomonas pictorum JCM 9942]|jgi:nucleoside-diphosphate-sugar epimerase|uniref:Nucleoside-diphosphate sugar epimerase n=1 Tax=Stenotrophomonas pictorum JCM 9942 TaxID=1236960 RepID=A0A0R0ABL9_9GAMM|nr:NAD-dependent epimerase/dehydratase family protein [Stenotrophomonas pictorum]KRG42197.1 nucleoside-diphosphate sugar epimerase [Stenotrophomonas pictorum JCM 9942]
MENDTRVETGLRKALLFGASGQIGERVLANLLAAGWEVTAVSRHAQVALPGVRWQRGDLSGTWQGEEGFDAVFSCGPLDHFARWYAASDVHAPKVVAFGSTSVDVKQDSPEPAERDVAGRLRQAEQVLFKRAKERGVAATVLRPTLVYGAGRDKTLSVIAALAARTGFFVLPHCANGLRQPVHVQDLADAALQVVRHPAAAGRAYALGGGEVLGYGEMVQRVLASLPARPRLWSVPTPLFRLALRLAHASGRLQGMNAATLARMRDPLVFDIEPARRDFGYAPRPFIAEATMFTTPAAADQ